MESKDTKSCTLYLIGKKDTDFVKIGISSQPEQRVKNLQLQYPYDEIELLAKFYFGMPADKSRRYAKDIEKKLHDILYHKRIQGEWFILRHDQILTLFDFIKVCFKLSYSGKMEALRERIDNYKGKDIIFTPTKDNKPYFFN
jgi:hypothetical protein